MVIIPCYGLLFFVWFNFGLKFTLYVVGSCVEASFVEGSYLGSSHLVGSYLSGSYFLDSYLMSYMVGIFILLHACV